MPALHTPRGLAPGALLCAGLALAAGAAAAQDRRPNILMILADDLGYSDIGAFGSEIRTPNLDALAAQGMVLTNVHAAPVCNVSRIELMTGMDSRIAMDPDGPAFASRTALRHDALTIGEALRAAGYSTYMAGKWDLGQREDQVPIARGFDRSFAMLPGTSSHYDEPAPDKRQPVYWENGDHVVDVPDDFYSTKFYTDKILEYLDEGDGDRPFFAYLAYTAPHFPVQAPVEYIDKYDGMYDAGYDAVRRARLDRMTEAGVIPEGFASRPLPGDAIAWEDWPSDEERALEARRMQVYAGMIDYMDEQIGRLLSHLDETGQLANTFIVFSSDNGAAGTWTPPVFVEYGDGKSDNSLENLGLAGSYMSSGKGWGWVSNAPFSRYKQEGEEGGHSEPTIAVLPGTIEPGSVSDALITLRDVLPTFLDAAGAELPATTATGAPTVPLDGRSAFPLLSGDAVDAPHAGEVIAVLSEDDRYLYLDGWKIVWNDGRGAWSLYDIARDRGETTDLANANPEKLRELVAAWEVDEARVAAAALK